VSLASSFGPVENLKLSRRHGCRSHSCQTSMMLAVEIPSSPASSRDDQWVTPSRLGGGSSVVATTFASSTVLGRPERGRSSSALIPAAAYRDRHSRTGRRPVLAAGNSNGDIPMLEFTQHPDKPSLRLLLLHDDSERESGYISGAEQALDQAGQNGWTVVSMKSDWATIF
jgi:hypothetical protein